MTDIFDAAAIRAQFPALACSTPTRTLEMARLLAFSAGVKVPPRGFFWSWCVVVCAGS